MILHGQKAIKCAICGDRSDICILAPESCANYTPITGNERTIVIPSIDAAIASEGK